MFQFDNRRVFTQDFIFENLQWFTTDAKPFDV